MKGSRQSRNKPTPYCIIYQNVFKEICYYWTDAYSKEAAEINLQEDEDDVSKILLTFETYPV